MIDDGRGAQNTYGFYPLYLMREEKGYFHLVYLRNPMDIFLNRTIIKGQNGYKDLNTITYKLTGGVIHLKFFIGKEKNLEEVIKCD